MDGCVLALDYGAERIGVAITDPERRHALAWGVMAAQPRETAINELRDLLAAESVKLVVVGLPLTLAGTEGPQVAETRVFAEAVRAATRLQVDFVDERFTSVAAAKAAAEKGTAPDAEAARLILESWLQQQQRKRS